MTDTPWTRVNRFKRYCLKFPCYPFRTLCPWDRLTRQTKAAANDFTAYHASPLLPANTQLDITFHRRALDTNYLDYFLAENLDPVPGTQANLLTAAQCLTATSFNLRAAAAGQPDTIGTIRTITIQIQAAALQVHPLGLVFWFLCVLTC